MDNRLQLPSTRVDFTAVGVTGQAHDTYPSPGQARYDHLRMYLIALLANQSSASEPTQYREGSLWFDLGNLTIKLRRDNAWVSLAEGVELSGTTLSEWVTQVDALLSSLAPELTFSGTATNLADRLPIPAPLQSGVTNFTRPFVWVNGILQDPRTCSMQSTTEVLLDTINLEPGDRYTVVLKGFPGPNFYIPSVSVP